MRVWVVLAGINGAMAVGMAAWASHGLSGPGQVLAERASQFQMFHAVALLALAGLPLSGRRWAGMAWCAGIVLFSGSLYLKAWVLNPPVPMLTPAGGIAFLAGWLMLALAGFRRRD